MPYSINSKPEASSRVPRKRDIDLETVPKILETDILSRLLYIATASMPVPHYTEPP